MMGKITIVDDLLAPQDYITVNYKGKNPFMVCTMFLGILRDVMKISSIDLYENDVRWDITDDPRTFYGVWFGKRGEDNWSTSRIKIRAQGAQSSKDKTGWITIMIKGWLETKHEYTNFIQKSFWWFFNYMFYYKQRRKYIEFSKDNIYQIREKITQILGISREEKLL
ncbi:MAG: hypothetical protein NT129_06015 [Candidatus Aenigmarchaeota archaeon]|nr:hypothetical protein [Candidatus Aenigmarchaeota archaeon]